MLATRDLAIYASIIATLNGIWSLYHNVFRDRARIKFRVFDATCIDPNTKIQRPGVSSTISNRGRRPTNIETIGFWSPKEKKELLPVDWVKEVPFRLAEGEGKSFFHFQDNPKFAIPKPYRPFARNPSGRSYPFRRHVRVIWKKLTKQFQNKAWRIRE